MVGKYTSPMDGMGHRISIIDIENNPNQNRQGFHRDLAETPGAVDVGCSCCSSNASIASSKTHALERKICLTQFLSGKMR